MTDHKQEPTPHPAAYKPRYEADFRALLGETLVGWTADLQWAYDEGRDTKPTPAGGEDLEARHADAVRLSEYMRKHHGWTINSTECALMLDVAIRLGIVQEPSAQPAGGEAVRDAVAWLEGHVASSDNAANHHASVLLDFLATLPQPATDAVTRELVDALNDAHDARLRIIRLERELDEARAATECAYGDFVEAAHRVISRDDDTSPKKADGFIDALREELALGERGREEVRADADLRALEIVQSILNAARIVERPPEQAKPYHADNYPSAVALVARHLRGDWSGAIGSLWPGQEPKPTPASAAREAFTEAACDEVRLHRILQSFIDDEGCPPADCFRATEDHRAAEVRLAETYDALLAAEAAAEKGERDA